MSQAQTSTLPVSFEFISGDRPAVRSLELAEHFGLKHKNILRDIEALLSKLPDSFTGLNFEPSTYEDPTGRSLPCFLLTRDAFTLLVMGWNSQRAMEWKLRYIEAFNSLERAAVENLRADALAQGAKMALAVPAERLDRMAKAVQYQSMGLTLPEIAKLVDMGRSGVCHLLRQARSLGLVAATPPARRRRSPAKEA